VPKIQHKIITASSALAFSAIIMIPSKGRSEQDIIGKAQKNFLTKRSCRRKIIINMANLGFFIIQPQDSFFWVLFC